MVPPSFDAPYSPVSVKTLALIWLSAVLLCSSAMAAITADPRVVRVPRSQGQLLPADAYYASLLALALEKTRGTDGAFSIVPIYQSVTSNRLIYQLAGPARPVDVIWTSNSKERDKLVLPIKISVLRGLNSFRIFLVRKGEQRRFDGVKNVQDLKLLKAGQGAHWPDTAVLQANGLPVVGAARSEMLFDMLKQQRFDYFPRGVHEIWDEQKRHEDSNIVIEDTLMLHYPAPIYFFVNRNDAALANRIERGLRIAQQDGSFETLFLGVPAFKKGHELVKSKRRKVLRLKSDFPDQD